TGTGPVGDPPRGFARIIGASAPIEAMRRLARKAASSSIPVLIEGESGVGKELFARAIHETSARADGPFVVVNCGAIPENLVEAVLFGHEKGAFTDARTARAGKFQEASGGTLFLDEVGELPAAAQVKLLRALQEGEVDPIGARQPVKVDIRLISATNRSLDALVAEGIFRQDLYYRLAVFPLRLPPLRARREDIAPIAEAILDTLARREGLARKRLDDETLRLLQAHDWPGNVRQLHNLLFRAVVLSEGEELTPRDFPELLRDDGTTPALPSDPALASDDVGAASGTFGTTTISLIGGDGRVRNLRDLEREIIARALALTEGCMSETARLLGIGRSTLYRKILQYDIDTTSMRAGEGMRDSPDTSGS
ncbi:MAG: sigma-54-dependent Fis family transcriptional regulator, partial [Alphaproteobacteria bacterium]